MLRETEAYGRSSKFPKGERAESNGCAGSGNRRSHHYRHSNRHSNSNRHASPKAARNKSRNSSSRSGLHNVPSDDDYLMGDVGKNSPPPKALKMSHKRMDCYNNDEDSGASMSPGNPDGTQLYDLNRVSSLASMNMSDSSTSPESPSSKNDLKYKKYSHGDSTSSGVSSMSSGGSDTSPSSYGDKERERSINGESTDPGSDGSSPMPSSAYQSNFKSSLSTVVEIGCQLPDSKTETAPSDVGPPNGATSADAAAANKSCLVCGDRATG